MKTSQLKVEDHSPKLDRKELSVPKTLIPLWFRGADMKLAQASLKMSTKLNRLTQASNVKRSFVFDFHASKTDEANEFSLGTHFACFDGVNALLCGYFANEVGEEIMPIEGLIAQINDVTRIDARAGETPTLGAKMEDFHKEIIEMLQHVNGHASVIHASISESTVDFALQARNNHGRVFVFKLSPDNVKKEEQLQ